ncbi:hypothetical protein GCM10007063_05880 [Lentibacillus kapialis]|uniref:HNH nuclease domain-containing protein n=1 Tax=Lentibacillus kapialis TaxID=340214 RepID=A0A917PNW9_9BACI|nr:HNH endonuclease [Lentibacillus kapialis]GGJ86194.1 hypothetical protein GCM10007063_05880 [Lentibacillus kapialis]
MQVPKINPNHRRRKPKQSDVTRITQKARKEVLYRSEGKCECCGRMSAYAFEVAHLKGAGQYGPGYDPSNLVLVCGPSVNSNTCHHWLDSTAEGRNWRMKKRKELMELYGQSR